MLKCSRCKKYQRKSNFHKNKSKRMGYSYICKKCQKIYTSNYYKNLTRVQRNNRYLRNLRKKLAQSGQKSDKINFKKVYNLKWDLLDYPDYQLSESLSHEDFMKKYNLNINEYIFIRRKVMKNKIKIDPKQ